MIISKHEMDIVSSIWVWFYGKVQLSHVFLGLNQAFVWLTIDSQTKVFILFCFSTENIKNSFRHTCTKDISVTAIKIVLGIKVDYVIFSHLGHC